MRRYRVSNAADETEDQSGKSNAEDGAGAEPLNHFDVYVGHRYGVLQGTSKCVQSPSQTLVMLGGESQKVGEPAYGPVALEDERLHVGGIDNFEVIVGVPFLEQLVEESGRIRWTCIGDLDVVQEPDLGEWSEEPSL